MPHTTTIGFPPTPINHLLFADDVAIIFTPTEAQKMLDIAAAHSLQLDTDGIRPNVRCSTAHPLDSSHCTTKPYTQSMNLSTQELLSNTLVCPPLRFSPTLHPAPSLQWPTFKLLGLAPLVSASCCAPTYTAHSSVQNLSTDTRLPPDHRNRSRPDRRRHEKRGEPPVAMATGLASWQTSRVLLWDRPCLM